MRPSSPSLPEHDFTLEALSQGLRVDGRGLLDAREVKIIFGEELGMVECIMGRTRVLAQVEATMVRPPPERPLEGIITIHSEISPMASSDFEIGRTSEEEVLITRMLEKVVRRSDSVDRESLCVVAGQRVWHLRITVHFLADDGNMLDCACLAAIVALKHFRRPEVEVIGDEVNVHAPEERAPVPLSLHHTPYVLTFATFLLPSTSATVQHHSPMLPTVTIVDPTHLESVLATGTLSLALTAQREICVMQKAGGAPLERQEILGMVDVGVKRVREVDAFVEKEIREDWAKRVVEVR